MERANYVVRRGFFSTFVQSICAVVVVALLCATAIGVYSLREVSSKLDNALGISQNLLTSLPELLPRIQESLPPAVADAVHDVRSPQYRDELDLKAQVISVERRGGRVLVEVANNGDEVVSLLAVRVNLVNSAGLATHEMSTYLATPLMIDNDWRGPIMPHSTRQCVLPVWGDATNSKVQVEVADVRIWQQKDAEQAVASTVPTAD